LDGAPAGRELRPVDALVHPLPLLRPHQLALASWIAERYRCGLADAVRAMVPPALASRARSPRLDSARGERTEAVFALETAGRDALAGSVRVGARQLATLRALAAGAVTARDLADAGGSADAARALARRGLVVAGRRGVRRIPIEFALPDEDRARDLAATGPQAVAIGAITEALGSGRGFLLHGVTASGKTEVYLRAATAALARGEGVIVLVPEIILTAQVVARFIARFGDRVALLHSALSAGERFDEWRRILDGIADVVIGSRSALFAPLERVGLVVVDEEQEPSYKQESDPRYHAVDAALELGRITGAAVVLGSATPRVVTYEAARRGELTSLPLPERVGDLALPRTTVVDLRLELRTGNRGTLSQALRQALQRTVAAGDQAILYLNRRGFATVVLCRDCGYVAKCPACEIPYAYHADGSLVGHRRGRREPEAAEGRFEWLTPVLGRSARVGAGGPGIVPTYLPEHYAFRAAAAHDYVAFAEAELEGRRRFGYPPFGRLTLLSTQAKKIETVERRSRELAARLREAAGDDAEVLGPAPAFAAKRAGSYRAQIVLRCNPERVLDRVTVSDEWTVDVDPVTLLG